jgi:hypothetical protein
MRHYDRWTWRTYWPQAKPGRFTRRWALAVGRSTWRPPEAGHNEPVSRVYDHYFDTFLNPTDLVWSCLTALVMAIVIMLVHTYYGFTASGGAAGVGEAVGRAVRSSLITAVLVVLVLTLAIYGQSPDINLSGYRVISDTGLASAPRRNGEVTRSTNPISQCRRRSGPLGVVRRDDENTTSTDLACVASTAGNHPARYPSTAAAIVCCVMGGHVDDGLGRLLAGVTRHLQVAIPPFRGMGKQVLLRRLDQF